MCILVRWLFSLHLLSLDLLNKILQRCLLAFIIYKHKSLICISDVFRGLSTVWVKYPGILATLSIHLMIEGKQEWITVSRTEKTAQLVKSLSCAHEDQKWRLKPTFNICSNRCLQSNAENEVRWVSESCLKFRIAYLVISKPVKEPVSKNGREYLWQFE